MAHLDVQLTDYPAFDPVTFGRHARAARELAGYSDLRHLSADLKRLGIIASVKAIHDIEQGRRIPSYPFVACLAALCAPHVTREFFEDAFTRPVLERLRLVQRTA